jgi:hypothetical protein
MLRRSPLNAIFDNWQGKVSLETQKTELLFLEGCINLGGRWLGDAIL